MSQRTPTVGLHQIAEYLDPQTIEEDGPHYEQTLTSVAQYLGQQRFLKRQSSRWEAFSITKEGIDELEGRNEPQQPSVMFNMEGSTFNQSPVGMNNTNSFTGDLNFTNVEQRIENEANEEDKEELRQLVAEVRELLDNGQSANKGFLARWNDKLQKYDWLRGAVAGWLLNFGTQSVAGG
jgi:hypothetical protein